MLIGSSPSSTRFSTMEIGQHSNFTSGCISLGFSYSSFSTATHFRLLDQGVSEDNPQTCQYRSTMVRLIPVKHDLEHFELTLYGIEHVPLIIVQQATKKRAPDCK
jgi:hypothetical protein